MFPSPPSTSSSRVRSVTADGSSLSCSGSRIIPLRFRPHLFEWPIQQAPVSLPITGFLCHHRLLLDNANQRVFSPTFPGSPEINLASTALSSSSSLRANLLSPPQYISNLLSEYPDVLFTDGFTTSLPRHQIPHHLLTLPGPPVFSKP